MEPSGEHAHAREGKKACPFDGASEAHIRRQFDTNVLGMMAVTRVRLPHVRQRQQGCVVNMASVGGRVTFPLYSPYHSTKWAVEGFSASLRYEALLLMRRIFSATVYSNLVRAGTLRAWCGVPLPTR